MMSPMDYIIESTKILNLAIDERNKKPYGKKEKRLTVDEVIEDRLDGLHEREVDFEKAFNEGTLDAPTLDYTFDTQDGLHRTIWASIRKKMNEIPVYVRGEKK